MPKSDNPHFVRIYNGLKKYAGEETAERIIGQFPLSKSAEADKKHIWAENVCAALRKEFDDETIKEIRMDCACGPETGKINTLKKIYTSAGSLEEFAEKADEKTPGADFWTEGGALFLSYPTCYCSCVKRVDKLIDEAWCYCTLGYTKKMFDTILDYEVAVQLLESVKTGGAKCVMKITF